MKREENYRVDLTPIYRSCDTFSLTTAESKTSLLKHFGLIVSNITHLSVFRIKEHVIGSDFAHDNLFKTQLWHLEMHSVEKVYFKACEALEAVFRVDCLSNCN